MAKRGRHPPAEPQPATSTALSTLSLKSVSLHDWWLALADGKALAVAGFESRGTQGVRAFSSAPIAKRHDATSLETIDGVNVTLSGFINRSRTHQNGFPLELCSHFLFGFPYYWEEYATRCCTPGVDGLNSSSGDAVPASLHPLSATCIHDLFIFSLADSSIPSLNNILLRDDALENFTTPTSKQTLPSAPASRPNSIIRKKVKADPNCHAADDVKTRKSKAFTPSLGVATRSMTRLKNLANTLENDSSSKYSTENPLLPPTSPIRCVDANAWSASSSNTGHDLRNTQAGNLSEKLSFEHGDNYQSSAAIRYRGRGIVLGVGAVRTYTAHKIERIWR